MQNNQQAPKGFHRLTIEERLDQIASMTELGQDEIQCLKKFGNLPEETANGMVENVIGVMGIPFGVFITPSTALYWHIGETTIRFSSSKLLNLSFENSLLPIIFYQF
jgi:hypothetical protein